MQEGTSLAPLAITSSLALCPGQSICQIILSSGMYLTERLGKAGLSTNEITENEYLWRFLTER